MSQRRTLFIFLGIFLVVTLDQLTKFLINYYIPLNTIYFSLGDNFFRLIHVRNTGVAFSLGDNFPNFMRILFFIIIPILALLFVTVLLILKNKVIMQGKYPLLNEIGIILIIGGGLGNIIDRLLRKGVIDFLDFRFYGLFGLERWPAFNLADSCVFVGFFLWLLSDLLLKLGTKL